MYFNYLNCKLNVAYCISYLFCWCGKISIKRSKELKFYFGSQFEGKAHDIGERHGSRTFYLLPSVRKQREVNAAQLIFCPPSYFPLKLIYFRYSLMGILRGLPSRILGPIKLTTLITTYAKLKILLAVLKVLTSRIIHAIMYAQIIKKKLKIVEFISTLFIQIKFQLIYSSCRMILG